MSDPNDPKAPNHQASGQSPSTPTDTDPEQTRWIKPAATAPDSDDDKTRMVSRASRQAAPAPVVNDDLTRVSAPRKKPGASVNTPSNAPSPKVGSSPMVDSSAANTGAPVATEAVQFTQYKASNTNHSAGFAKARELAEQSQRGEGAKTLLKKRFLLEDVLGHGGMGTVYRAKDLRKVEAEDPNPYIATKVLNQDFRDHPDAFVTLQQEAAKSQTLAHPNIVTVHDFDRDGDTLFMTMELLKGQPLDRLIKAHHNQGLPKDQVWAITRDLCAALAYAHQRQLIHADFKPGNVFVCEGGSTKVLDFGIARAASKESQKHHFDAGQLGALTPAYATVEMVQDEPLSFTDDVYALACVVYEMLAGQHPYNNRSAFDAVQQKLVPKPIAGLTKKEWRALSHGLALHKRDRTPTVNQFADELFPKRHAAMLRMALALAGVSLMGAAWFGFDQYQTRMQAKQVIAEKIAAAQLCFAQSDFACAVEHSLIATNLDAENQVARQLLQAAQLAKAAWVNEEKIAQLLLDAENCLAEKDAACTQVKAREVLGMTADNPRAQQLLTQADGLEQDAVMQEYARQVDTCLAEQDMGCVQMFTDKAQALNPEHRVSRDLALKWQVLQQETQSNALRQQQKLQAELTRAQACMSQKDYTCALDRAAKALAVEPSSVQAIEIKQAAQLAQQQARDVSRKIEKLLGEATDCMNRKNYSCTIAKAESALDLDSGNEKAMAIKLKAQETQRKLKETGFIIK